MRILIPYDINTTGMRNPFLYLLMDSLKRAGNANQTIEHGYGWLEQSELNWDIIHIHWPEELVRHLLPGSFSDQLLSHSHINKLVTLLRSHQSRGSKIVTTVHNLLPHKYKSEIVKTLYKEIFSLTDAFVHLGNESIRLTKEMFSDEMSQKRHEIIPHGDYSFFDNSCNRQEARSRLNIDQQQKVMLTFGAFRSLEELGFGIDALKKAGLEKEVLYLIAGKLPYSFKSQAGYYPMKMKLLASRNFIKVVEKIIPPDEVQYFMNASDLVFISRSESLNSGNVALGFTFGKVVVGPDFGVIGEDLRLTENPVYQPSDVNSAANAIVRGFELCSDQKGVENQEFSERYRRWITLSEKHINLYNDCLKA